MRPVNFIALLLLNALVLPAAQANLEAHEWGTFTSLMGSNGITQNGMYHEDEALPSFVHGFGEVLDPNAPPFSPDPPTPVQPTRPCRSKACFENQFLDHNVITQKMETPVIYFYTDKPQHVSVDVHFPDGYITDTFPAPTVTSPTRKDAVNLGDGHSTFEVDVLSADQSVAFPYVDASNIYSHARNVASNPVQAGQEQERFIFYRGLGRFQPAISITSKDGTLNLRGPKASLPQAAFLVSVDDNGDGRMLDLGTMKASQTRSVSASEIANLKNHTPNQKLMGGVVVGDSARQTLIKALVRSGLKVDEATAMVDTWENGYLKVPGLRLLYILPRAEIDRVLPVTMTPVPDSFQRVFVGRMEIVLDTDEQRILSDILVHGDSFDVTTLGRFAEPILRRELEVYEANLNHRKHDDDSATTIELLNRLIARSTGQESGGSTAVH